MPVGPGATLDALAAVEAAGFSDRGDFRAAAACGVRQEHEHTLLFDQVFDTFWKRRGLIEKLIAMMSPQAPSDKQAAEAGRRRRASRRAQQSQAARAQAQAELQFDMRLTMSADEILQRKDFAQMTADEILRARELIAHA